MSLSEGLSSIDDSIKALPVYPVTVQEFYNKQSELPEGSSIFEILFALANDKTI